MSNVTTDFITATKKLHADVCHMLTELKLPGRDVKAIREQGDPKGDQPESTKSHPSNTAIPTPSKKYKTYEARQYALERLRLRIEKQAFRIGKWTAIILAIYTGFTILMYFATNKAADAAKSAADTAFNQMGIMKDTLALERPWLGPSGTVSRSLGAKQPPSGQPIDWQKNKLVGMAARIQNGGRNPGTNVRWHMLFKLGKPYNAAEETSNYGLPTDDVCDKGELSSNYGSGTIMGGVITELPVWIPKDIGEKGPTIFSKGVGLYIVGCLDYSDTTFKPWYRTNMRWVFNPSGPEPFVMTRFGNESR